MGKEEALDFDWNVLVNYGALGICLAYFIYKDMKTNKETRDTLDGLKDVITGLKEVVSVLKEAITKR